MPYAHDALRTAIRTVSAMEIVLPTLVTEDTSVASLKVVGPGVDPRSQLAPIQNRQQFEKLKGTLADWTDIRRVFRPGNPLIPLVNRDT
jgi:hypothetical protein